MIPTKAKPLKWDHPELPDRIARGAQAAGVPHRAGAWWADVQVGELNAYGFFQGEKLVGHVLADLGPPDVAIIQAYVDPGVNVGRASLTLFKSLELLGLQRGSSRVKMLTDRNPKGWTRKYGFQVAGYVMVKPLGA